MSRLVLVRHAEPESGALGRVYGSLDVGLSDEGRRAAETLADSLQRFAYTAVYTSPRRRAVETAAPIAARRRLAAGLEPELCEIDFGELEGRTYEEIARDEPELFRAWMEAPTTVRFPGGESFSDLRVRALRTLEAIRERQDCAVVVTHGGIVRAGLAAWLGMPDRNIFRLAQDHCGTSVVDWIDDVPIVRLANG